MVFRSLLPFFHHLIINTWFSLIFQCDLINFPVEWKFSGCEIRNWSCKLLWKLNTRWSLNWIKTQIWYRFRSGKASGKFYRRLHLILVHISMRPFRMYWSFCSFFCLDSGTTIPHRASHFSRICSLPIELCNGYQVL